MIDDAVSAHEKVWGLIPWFVNGRLNNADAVAVEEHLAACAACRDECAMQAKIHDAIRDEDSVAFASEASYRKLASRIDTSREQRSVAKQSVMRWLVAAVVIESVGLVAWGAWSWQAQREAAAPYVTLSNAADAALVVPRSSVRVVFTTDSTLEDVQRLLRSVDARIVDGPTESGVYTIAFNGAHGSEDDRVNALRASQLVRFAEPVFMGTGASP